MCKMAFFEAIFSFFAELIIISWIKTLGMWTRYVFLNLFTRVCLSLYIYETIHAS